MFDTEEAPATTHLPARTSNLQGGMGWTYERIELLRKLWLDGLSASQIAGILGGGLSRNAVIGKVHRLKLGGRAKPPAGSNSTPRQRRTGPRQPRQQPRLPYAGKSSVQGRASSPSAQIHGTVAGALRRKGEEEPEVEAFTPPPELFIPVESRLTLLQIGEDTCKWPIGDPLTPDFYFCGQHSEKGKPYCDFHSRRAYHQIEKKRRAT